MHRLSLNQCGPAPGTRLLVTFFYPVSSAWGVCCGVSQLSEPCQESDPESRAGPALRLCLALSGPSLLCAAGPRGRAGQRDSRERLAPWLAKDRAGFASFGFIRLLFPRRACVDAAALEPPETVLPQPPSCVRDQAAAPAGRAPVRQGVSLFFSPAGAK